MHINKCVHRNNNKMKNPVSKQYIKRRGKKHRFELKPKRKTEKQKEQKNGLEF